MPQSEGAATIRRTICDFATAPRNGTPFHILNTMRFNPLMERFEVLAHRAEDDARVWAPATFHCEPSVWLRRIPLPYEIPDGQWFPVMTATYMVRRRRSLRRFLADLIFRVMCRRAKPTPIAMQWHGKWTVVPASVDRSGEADETSTKIEGSAEGESAVTPKAADAQTSCEGPSS